MSTPEEHNEGGQVVYVEVPRCGRSGDVPTRNEFDARFSLGVHRAVTCEGCGAKVTIHPKRLDWTTRFDIRMADHLVPQPAARPHEPDAPQACGAFLNCKHPGCDLCRVCHHPHVAHAADSHRDGT